MSDSWLSPKLLEKIANNVPFLQRALLALVKQDPSSIADVPKGGKRLVEISQGKWQLQQFNGTSWEPLGKLQMDVDTVDSFNAALTPQPNVIPVRDENGDLPGNITGHAATADSAETLSQTLVVEKGGTGATTPEQARVNLGVPPISHASSKNAYGLGSNLNYGHVRGDGETANVISGEVTVKDVAILGVKEDKAGGRGIFNSASKGAADYNDLRSQGAYTATDAATNGPGGARRVIVWAGQKDDPAATQLALPWLSSNRDQIRVSVRSSHPTNGWAEWVDLVTSRMFASPSVPGIAYFPAPFTVGDGGQIGIQSATVSRQGIVQLYNGIGSDSTEMAPTAAAVKKAYDRAEEAYQKALAAIDSAPPGTLFASLAKTMPGCIIGQGAVVSRTTYASLFSLYGTAFGVGDGSTTFALPDFRSRVFWGAGSANLWQVIAAGLPNITGSITRTYASAKEKNGALSTGDAIPGKLTDGADNARPLSFSAQDSNAIYGRSTTVQPPAIAVNIFIKY